MDPITTPKLAPYLVTNDAAGLAKFIRDGIGGKPGFEERDKDGKYNHLEMQITDSVVMLADAPSGSSLFPAMIHLYVTDADGAYKRALKAGAESVRAPSDQVDGRRGGVRDKWGNQWWFTQRKE